MFMTLIVWDTGTKKIKDRTKKPNLIVNDFSLTFVNLSLAWISNSMYDFRIRENF